MVRCSDAFGDAIAADSRLTVTSPICRRSRSGRGAGAAGARIVRVMPDQRSLEEVYLDLVGAEHDDCTAGSAWQRVSALARKDAAELAAQPRRHPAGGR